MNASHLREPRRIGSRLATAKTLAAAFALGAMLAAGLQAATPPNTIITTEGNIFRPVLAPGGINVQSNITIAISGIATSPTATNVSLNVQGLQAPYDIQSATDPINGPWTHAGYMSLKWPNVTGTGVTTNQPAGSFFRACMLGMTNHAGRYAGYTDFVGVSNVFVGVQNCNGCHGDKVAEWSGTGHARAYTDLTNALSFPGGMAMLPNCIACHTVGSGQSGGFLSITNTPQLANVQCEVCHGPGNDHIYVSGLDYRPARTIAPELCGGCHSGSHNPQYDEYKTTLHAQVNLDNAYGVSSGTFVPDNFTNGNGVVWNGYILNADNSKTIAAGFVNSTNDISGLSRQMSCGPCHSGATRMAMLENLEDMNHGLTNKLVLPNGHDASLWGPTCATCHDPHVAENPKQLRNPVRSTNYFTYFTTTPPPVTNFFTDVFGQSSSEVTYRNDGFASQYDPNIQICGQCHNSRGARWDGVGRAWDATNNQLIASAPSFSRPPHHSPQYNVLIGIVQPDYLNMTTNIAHPHSGLTSTANTNQCATCHVPSYSVSSSTNITGHTFALDVKGCALAGCHTSYTDDGLNTKIEERQRTASNNLARVVGLLNQWAATKSDPAIRTPYGALAWEYQMAGLLGNPTQNPTIVGPTSSPVPSKDQQKYIPDAIKKARFNLYMVRHDGSTGVHNPSYIDYLIRDADTNVTSQFPLANFTAKAVAGFAPFAVTFTNLGGGTTYVWDFGDGVGTSSSANPTYTYTTPGTYTVTCTANGTETMTRSNYIQAVNKPVVAFTADQTTVPVGTLVTFTNNSSILGDVSLWRWTFNLTNSNTRVDAGYTPTISYTYTNTGTFSVSLRATTPAGSITTTNKAYITVQ